MKPKQYVCVVPFGWEKPVFGQIKKLDENQPHFHVLVYVDRLWGSNHHLEQFESNPQLKGIDLTCAIKEVVELDWTTYWKQVDKKDRSDHDIMQDTYNVVGIELSWKHKENKEYDYRLKQREVHAKIAAFKPKPVTPFKKNDVVVVRNINGYKDQEHQALVAAMGPKKIQAGEQIRDIMWKGIRYSVPVDAEVLSDTQALVLYTNGFPATKIYDVVQWQRTGGRNFASKSVLKL